MRISDWSSDVCSSDLHQADSTNGPPQVRAALSQPDPAQGHCVGLAVGGRRLCRPEIGRASCRERVCQYVYISVVAVPLKHKQSKTHIDQSILNLSPT